MYTLQRFSLLSLLCFILTITLVTAQKSTSYDILIIGGKILDGTGNPWYYSDIGIKNGRIVELGQLKQQKAAQIIHAKGKVVTPGFIDIHSHADDGSRSKRGLRSNDPKRRAAPNLVAQGITTVVVNQDGRSAWPIKDQLKSLREKKTGPNVIVMFGHGTLRRLVMKNDFRREATESEIKRMQDLALQAMREGAFGMSAGLEYVPGRWSATNELVAIMQAIAPPGGIYISHPRSEGADPMWYWPTQHAPGAPTLIDAVMETIEIGEKSGATVVASHIKTKGAHYWGSGHAAIQLIEKARARGVSIWADQYPYNTSGTDGNTVLIPRWVFGQGGAFGFGERQKRKLNFTKMLRERLAIEGEKEKIEKDIAHEIRRRGGAENIIVFAYPDSSYIGKSLRELAKKNGMSAVEMAFKLQLEGTPTVRGGARLRGFSMSESDLEAYAAQPWTATSSDAGIAFPEDGPVHARFYGTFPRKIRRYAIDRGLITIEDAIRSMTSLPAQILGLRDRGMLLKGFYADITILDLKQLSDKATFMNPHQYPEGVEYVLVNGQFVLKEGALTWALPGEVITRRAKEGKKVETSN